MRKESPRGDALPQREEIVPRRVEQSAEKPVALGKRETPPGAGGSAALRHDLARLGRRSGCFTRSAEARRCAAGLFQRVYNPGQGLRQEEQLKRVPGLCDCLPLVR